MPKQKITIWERWFESDNDYHHNHIENGWIGGFTGSAHDEGSAPIGDERQTANWAKGEWLNIHTYLIDGVVVNPWLN